MASVAENDTAETEVDEEEEIADGAVTETIDEKVVDTTYHGHPMPQCRLDTYFAAAKCDIASSVDTDNDDATIGTCNRQDNYTEGLRPLCWYKPEA